jgi:tetratricopeptide (TPR) repeat protein
MIVPGIFIAVVLAISSAQSVQSSTKQDPYRTMEAICGDTSFVYHISARISACTRLIRGQVGTPHQRAQVYRTRGIALNMLGHDTDALRDYDQALSLDPDFTDVLLRRAGQRSALGDRVGALADFDRAVRSGQDDPDVLLARAYFYLANGDAKRAAPDFDAALELLGPDDLAAPYHNRGLYEFEHGDYTSAIDHFSLSIASGGADPSLSLDYRGRAYLAVGDPERALSDFTRLANYPPYAWYAQPLRARALDALGRHLEARLTELRVWMWETAGTISHPRDPRDRLEFEVTAALNAHLPMLTPYGDEVILRCELVSWAISQRRPRSWACRDKLPVPRPL